MLYSKLWNILTAINDFEGNSCTLQIVREPFNASFHRGFLYESAKSSSLVEFSIRAMTDKSMPIFLVDLDHSHMDYYYRSIYLNMLYFYVM